MNRYNSCGVLLSYVHILVILVCMAPYMHRGIVLAIVGFLPLGKALAQVLGSGLC